MSISNQYPTLDFDLGETADQLRDTVRSFTADEIAPIAAEIDRTDRFPRELWPRMGALGLHGITVEETEEIYNRPRFFVRDPFGNRVEVTQTLGEFR